MKFVFSSSSAIVSEGAVAWAGFVTVSFTPKVDGREITYAAGTFGHGFNRGKASVEGEVSFIEHYFDDWADAHPGYMMIEIPSLIIVHQEGTVRHRWEIKKIAFTENPHEGEEDGALTTQLSFMGHDLLKDGKSVFEAGAADGGSAAGSGFDFGFGFGL